MNLGLCAVRQAAGVARKRSSEVSPQEVVQACLASLRKADGEALAAHLPAEALRHVHSEHWVAGFRATEGGPLAQAAGKYIRP